jgi:acyl-CoA reductase-like NAD-dependent aldehyde dehydrogenase
VDDINYDELVVDGKRVRAHGTGRIEVIDPATERRLGSIADGDAADVELAVRSAGRAFRSAEWAGLSADERGKLLERLADVLEKHAIEIGQLITAENGMPVSALGGFQGHAVSAAVAYRYFAQIGRDFTYEDLRPSNTLVRREPLGVVGVIAPWNGPQTLVAWKLAPALAAGCTAVIKPAPETTLDAFLLMDAIAEAGFPPGVVNLITGGRETGAALVEHPGVNKIAFTGSTAAGRAIAAACGAALKPVTLELGGKSAAVLLDDADVDLFASLVPEISAKNSGQVCYSCTRILAPRSRYDEVVEAIVEKMRLGAVGDPMSEATVYGPLVASRQRDRVEGYIAAGRAQGARVALGGGRPADLERGWFVEPTVFDHVSNDMKIAREEIFGPVLSVIPYDGEDEAVAIANDSEYGLGGSVFSADPTRGLAVARRIETGTVGVNGYGIKLDAPFGGVKSSGLGRELGPEGFAAYVQYKSIFNVTSDLLGGAR